MNSVRPLPILNEYGLERFKEPKQKLLFVTTQGSTIVQKDDILYLESSSNYCQVFFTNGKKICCSKTLKYILEKINCDAFVRVHRTYAINMNHVVYINSRYTELQLDNGTTIPISKNQKDNFKRILPVLFD